MKTILLFVLSTSIALAQASPRAGVDKFFKEALGGGSDAAISNAFASNKWMQLSGDAIVNLQDQMAGLTEDTFGKLYGHEVVKEKKLGENYVMLVAMARYDRQPIRFIFEYYRPNGQWVLHGLSFDIKMEEEF